MTPGIWVLVYLGVAVLVSGALLGYELSKGDADPPGSFIFFVGALWILAIPFILVATIVSHLLKRKL